MATNLKTGDTPKDNRVKPINLTEEQEQDLSVDQLQTSKIYQTENKALLESQNPQSQASYGSSEVMKGKNDTLNDQDEATEEKGDQNQSEKSKEKMANESDRR